MKRNRLPEIKALLHENLRAENLSLCRDGHSDIYYSGERDGKIEAYSVILHELEPEYDLFWDWPQQCEAPDCENWFFPKDGSRGGQVKRYCRASCQNRDNMRRSRKKKREERARRKRREERQA